MEENDYVSRIENARVKIDEVVGYGAEIVLKGETYSD